MPDLDQEVQKTKQALVEIDSARAIQEVQAQFVIAKRFPRDTIVAHSRILEACKRPALANEALYAYPRGKKEDGKPNIVSGPSIRLAEVLSQNWGNMQSGVRELAQHDGYSDMQAYALDFESNYRDEKSFTVSHIRATKRGSYKLTDPRDIYELTMNMAQRRKRACILAVIPGDVVEDAVKQCQETQKDEVSQNREDKLRKMVKVFGEIGITPEMIEDYEDKKIADFLPEDIVEMRTIFQSIKEGFTKKEEYFGGQTVTQSEETEKLDKEIKDRPKKISSAKQKEIRSRLNNLKDQLAEDKLDNVGEFCKRYANVLTVNDITEDWLDQIEKKLDEYEENVLEKETEKSGQQSVI